MSKEINNKMSAKVDGYLDRAKRWQEEMGKLREIALSCSLDEDLKWGKPCYEYHSKNVVIIVGFKEHCALIFAKGALMKDPKNLLILPGENTQAARQMRFSSAAEIDKLQQVIKSYIENAIEVEKSGKKVQFKKSSEHKIPEELQVAFRRTPTFEKAFRALTPGRQRAYLMHFSGAKQARTREARIEKCRPQIMKGQGLNDR